MRPLYLVRTGARTPSMVSHLPGGVVARYRWVTLAGGIPAILAVVDLDEVAAGRIDDLYQAIGGVSGLTSSNVPPVLVGETLPAPGPVDPIVEAVLARPLEEPAAVAPAPTEELDPLDLVQLHGWEAEDLDGAGREGKWGPDGGRGKRSGLSVAEMAAAKAPSDWKTASANKYPWECQGWQIPFADWQVPTTLPAKPRPASEQAGQLSTPPTVEQALAPTGAKPPAAAAGPVASAPTGDDELPREWAAMLAVVRTRHVTGAEAPTLRSLNYYLGRADLPKLEASTYALALEQTKPAP